MILGNLQRAWGPKILRRHDSGVVDHHIEVGVCGGQNDCGVCDGCRAGDVQRDRLDSWMLGGDLVEEAFAPTVHDYRVASFQQAAGQSVTDTRCPACDQDCITGQSIGGAP